ncbi:hypothetical protein CPB86DRAFT_867701 [Serendipita vermifera]|nr:hypothetical protein CPB86DRAFT_867701 [Serendipita vermifera]
MCRLTDEDLTCLLCNATGQRKCNHEIDVCFNKAVHPRWKVWYFKNAGGVSTFQGCGFCKNAQQANLKQPALDFITNPGWPGCCYPPGFRYYSWILPEDWPIVAAYHKMPIPPTVQQALENRRNKLREKPTTERISTDVSAHRNTTHPPVPIPRTRGDGGLPPRSYSPSAIYIPAGDRSPPPSSVSSRDSNSSGSPPSSNGSRRRDFEFEGSDRSGPSQDDNRSAIRPSSSLQIRRNESPGIGGGKRRSNSDPKNQSPPSAYGGPRDSVQTREREREKDMRFKSSTSTTPSNYPYSNPYASSSQKKITPVAPSVTSSRSRQVNGPSITSVLANLSLDSNKIPMDAASKRGVIPPHVKGPGSIISAHSSSSSSTNSSAREGTVVSDSFTDYLSDDSDMDLQRQAEIEAEVNYQEALKRHEEMEFRQARESLAMNPSLNRRHPMVPSASTRIRV